MKVLKFDTVNTLHDVSLSHMRTSFEGEYRITMFVIYRYINFETEEANPHMANWNRWKWFLSQYFWFGKDVLFISMICVLVEGKKMIYNISWDDGVLCINLIYISQLESKNMCVCMCGMKRIAQSTLLFHTFWSRAICSNSIYVWLLHMRNWLTF